MVNLEGRGTECKEEACGSHGKPRGLHALLDDGNAHVILPS